MQSRLSQRECSENVYTARFYGGRERSSDGRLFHAETVPTVPHGPTVDRNCNCSCKYDNLYSTVSCKLLQRCFTRLLTLKAKCQLSKALTQNTINIDYKLHHLNKLPTHNN